MATRKTAYKSKPKKGTARKSCKAVSQGNKCLLYEAKHSLKRAAKRHASAIKKRGGVYKMTFDRYNDETIIKYSFTTKKRK